jgi:hypothetical protein
MKADILSKEQIKFIIIMIHVHIGK